MISLPRVPYFLQRLVTSAIFAIWGIVLLGGWQVVLTGAGAATLPDRLIADPAFHGRFERENAGEIRAVLELPDGSHLVGGNFSWLDGVARSYLARLKADGGVDADWIPPALSGPVNAMILDGNGSIWIGGDFGFVEGLRSEGLAKLWPDLTLDRSTLDRFDANGTVYGLTLLSDGSVLAGGQFMVFGEGFIGTSDVIKLSPSGQRNPTFARTYLGGAARTMLELSEGRILVGGGNQAVDSVSPTGYVKMLNADGTNASESPDFRTTLSANGPVNLIKRFGDGSVVIGGQFSSFDNSSSRSRLVRFDEAGDLDDTFSLAADLRTAAKAIDDVMQIADGKLVVVGAGIPALVLDETGAVEEELVEASVFPRVITAMADSGFRVWGSFIGSDARQVLGVKAYDTAADLIATTTVYSRRAARVWQTALAPDDKVWVRGEFTHVEGVARQGLARINYDGTVDESFRAAEAVGESETSEMALDAQGRVLVHDGTKLNRLTADGALDETFSGPEYVGAGLAVARDGSLLISNTAPGGIFGDNRGVKKLLSDGTADSSFPEIIVSSAVTQIIPQPNGDIYLFGPFGRFNGEYVSSGVRLNELGERDSLFSSNVGNPSDYIALPGGGIVGWSPGKSVGVYYTDEAGYFGRSNMSNAKVQAVLPLPGDGFVAFNQPVFFNFVYPELFFLRHRFSGATSPALQISGIDAVRTKFDAPVRLNDGTVLLAGENLSASGAPQWGMIKLRSGATAAIVTQPESQTANLGDARTFRVGVSGDGVLRYQWFHNGVLLEGERDAELQIPNVGPDDVGDYFVRVEGPFNSLTSATVALGANANAPILVQSPTDAIGVAGEDVVLSVSATGTGALNYQWRKDGVAIPGENASSLTFTNLTRGHEGLYDVMVSQGLASVISSAATLRVDPTAILDRVVRDPNARGIFEATGGGVEEMLPTPDGKFVVSGEFSRIAGMVAPGLAKLNADFNVDTSFGPPTEWAIRLLAVQPDGKILVSRRVILEPYTPPSYLLYRLNNDGSVDETFETSEELSQVYVVRVEADGSLLVSLAPSGLVRLRSDGTRDASFVPPVFVNGSSEAFVREIHVQSDGKIIVVGNFSAVAESAKKTVARLNYDGSLDESFTLEVHSSDQLSSILLLPDDRILGAGFFYPPNLSYSHATSVKRFLSDGGADPSFVAGSPATRTWGSEFSLVQSDDRIWAVASRGSSAREVHLFGHAMDGALELEVELNANAYRRVAAVSLSGGGVGLGGFDLWLGNVGPNRRASLVHFNKDGILDDERIGATEIPVGLADAKIAPDGDLYVAGEFTRAAGGVRKGIARLHPDGSLDTEFDVGPGLDGKVTTLLPQVDGRVVVGGHFSTVAGEPAYRMVRLESNGDVDLSFQAERPTQNYFHLSGLAAWPDGGYIVTYGTASNSLTRLDAHGRKDARFNYVGGLATEAPSTLAVSANRDIYILERKTLKRLNQFGVAQGNGRSDVSCFTLRADGKLWVGGTKTIQANYPNGTPYSVAVPTVALLNSDLSVDFSFNGATPPLPDYSQSNFQGPSKLLAMSDGGVLVNDVYRSYRLAANGELLPSFAVGDLTLARVGLTGAESGHGATVFLVREDGSLMISSDKMWIGGVSRLGLEHFRQYAVGVITQAPTATMVDEGASTSLSVRVTGIGPFRYQWFRNGRVVNGATQKVLEIGPTRLADDGYYHVQISDSEGTLYSDPVRIKVEPSGSVERTLQSVSHLADLDAEEPLFISFRVEGSEPKQLLLRGLGPQLLGLGIADAMSDPRVRVLDASGAELIANDNWGTDVDTGQALGTMAAQLGAVSLNEESADAAVLYSAPPGNYVLEIRGRSAGKVLVELHDADAAPVDSRVVYLGLWARFHGQSDKLVVGLVRAEDAERDLLIRHLGPGVTVRSALRDPKFEIRTTGADDLLLTNDNWQNPSLLRKFFNQAGAADLTEDSMDAADLYAASSHRMVTVEFSASTLWTRTQSRGLLEIFDLAGRTPALAPVVLAPPYSAAVPVRSVHAFEVVAVGDSPISYQWYKNGELLAGQTSSYLLLLVAEADAGDYTVKLTNSHGSVFTPAVALTVLPPRLHSADTDQDYRIGLSELLRVIELYNTRFGSTRTGRYKVGSTSADGFDSDGASNDASTLTRHHAADTNRDGRLSLSELLRVIELYNTRSGTMRTGAYGPANGTTDGFAAVE